MIKTRTLPIQVVPNNASFSEAVDIFDKINSQGQTLTEAELALTHVTAKWGEARKTLKNFLEAKKKIF